MKKRTASSAELYIYSEIDGSGRYGISDKDVVAALEDVGEVDQLDIRINSGGGDVFAGIAIYEAIKRFPAKTTVYIDGLAASAASVIAMAGDERIISKAGFFMVHRASGGVVGFADDMRQMADVLDKISDRIAVIYNERTGHDMDELKSMIGAETWFDADESVAHGFATRINEDAKIENNTPQSFVDKLTNAQRAFNVSMKAQAVEPETAEDPPPIQENQQADEPALEAGFSLPNSRKETKSMSMESILRERLENNTCKAANVKNNAEAEERDLTTAEVAEINDLHDENEDIRAKLDALQKVDANTSFLNSSIGRKAEPEAAAAPKAQPAGQTKVIGSVAAKRSDGGFSGGFGEFSTAVYNVYTGGPRDERLFRNVESSYGTGGVGAEGGFAIPEDFRQQIQSNAIDQDPLISRCYQLPTNSRQVTLPTHESQPWDSESVQSYWSGEGASITRSKFAMKQVTVQLNKVAVLSFVTEELLEDAPALQAAVTRDATAKINFAVSNAIVRGSGVNQPLGFLNAPSLVTVAKETAGSAQTADTIKIENINKMYAAMPPRNRNNAVWLVHPDAEPQLWLGDFHTTGDPIGRMPGTLPNSPFGTLMGRPVIPHEVCETVGDLGDIMFVDLSDYALPMKQGGVKSQTSMHLAFDQDLMAFKFTLRIGGAPLWQGPVDSRDGSFDRSPFVALAARA